MKPIIYLLLSLIILSCSNSKKENIKKNINKTEKVNIEIKTKVRDSILKSSEVIFLAFKKNKFQSESDQDEFYIHFADSLKQINGNENSVLREKMTQAFRAVNELHSRLNYGGTFYTHQYKRLLAEVEYSIFKKENDTTSRKNFLLKKREYIKNWINHIEKKERDNVYNKMDTLKAKNRAKELESILDKIQTSVSNQVILDQVINFENQYYK